MAQLVYGAIGAVIGYYVGGPSGAQAGFAVGSAIGAAAAAPDVRGPRLSDLAVQISAYGWSIPDVFGSDRLAGNLVWSTGLKESESEEGAKGGPSLTTYSYSVSCAVLICEGEKQSIRRIWADAKLVYDASSTASSGDQAASALFRSFFVYYSGTEDQMPDPTIESYEGAGNVEPMRGSAYIVFTDLPLGDYGNRIPNFSFEMSDAPELPLSEQPLEPLRIYPWGINGEGIPSHNVSLINGVLGRTAYSSASSPGLSGADFNDIAVAQALAYSSDSTNPQFFSARKSTIPLPGFYSTSDNSKISALDGGASIGTDPEYVVARVSASKTYGGYFPRFSETSSGDELIPWLRGVPLSTRGWITTPRSSEAVVYRVEYDVFGPPINPSIGYESNYRSGIVYDTVLSVLYGNEVLKVSAKRLPSIPPNTCYPGADPCSTGAAVELPENPEFCYSCGGEVTPKFRYELVSGTARQLCAVEYRDGVLYQNAVGPVLLPADANFSNTEFWDSRFAAALASGSVKPDVEYPVLVTEYARGTRQDFVSVAATPRPLSEVVSKICVDTGLRADQIDVTGLTDAVLGYSRTRRMPGRSALEPLRQAFAFDAVESGDLIRFVKRGGAPAATLVLDDLAAGAEEASEQPVLSERGQQNELPSAIVIAYKALSADYQTGTQQSSRRVGGSQQLVSVEIPVVLGDQAAAQIPERLLYEAWVARNKRTFSTWRRWTGLEPTDVVLVDDGKFIYRVALGDKSEDGGVITFQAADCDAATYMTSAVGAETPGGGSTIRLNGPTLFVPLDIPLLRAEDDSLGYYMTACGQLDGWRGAAVYRSTDSGVNYNLVRDVVRQGSIGSATNVLSSFDGGNTVDELSSLSVRMVHGELTSITRDALLAGGNAAVIGAEVIQFQRAVLIDAETYQLTGLLRGRLGTEQHIATHGERERFVLLTPAGLYRASDYAGNINKPSLFKAVSYGATLDGTFAQPFIDTAVSSKPLAPVDLLVLRVGINPVGVSWSRRSRYTTLVLTSGTPLGEASEQYDVELFDASDALVRTDRVTFPSWSLTNGGATAGKRFIGYNVALASGSDYFGFTAFGSSSARVAKLSSAGAVVASSEVLGSSIKKIIMVGGSVYAIAQYIPPGEVLAAQRRVVRLLASNISAVAADYSTSVFGEYFTDITSDGVSIYVGTGDGLLLRLDITTLALLDTYPISAPATLTAVAFGAADSLFMAYGDYTGGTIVRWDIATEAAAWTEDAIPQAGLTGLLVLDERLLASSQDMQASYDISDGSLQYAASNLDGTSYGEIALLESTLYASQYNFVGGSRSDYLARIDPLTGALLERAPIVGGTLDLAILGSEIWVGETQYVFEDVIDLTGASVRVYQISESVGRGFPAAIAL